MKQLRAAIMAFILLAIIVGLIYPLFIILVGKMFFPYQTSGSLIYKNQQLIGSELIGQQFTSDNYLWSRPSLTGTYPYNALASGGSNLGPLNPQLVQQVKDRVAIYTNEIGATSPDSIPIDLVTGSGSGLDPDISLASGYYQMPRIAKARNMPVAGVKDIIDQYAKYPIYGILGEARVNVLLVNLALDK